MLLSIYFICFFPRQNIVLIRDPEDSKSFYPRFNLEDTSSFSELDEHRYLTYAYFSDIKMCPFLLEKIMWQQTLNILWLRFFLFLFFPYFLHFLCKWPALNVQYPHNVPFITAVQWCSKNVLKRLYYDYYFHRQETLWRQNALKTLPVLLNSSDMLACGEDLGMIPSCVHPVWHYYGFPLHSCHC